MVAIKQMVVYTKLLSPLDNQCKLASFKHEKGQALRLADHPRVPLRVVPSDYRGTKNSLVGVVPNFKSLTQFGKISTERQKGLTTVICKARRPLAVTLVIMVNMGST